MRLLIRVPTLAIDALSHSETTVNQQLAEIIETFFWESLPPAFGFSFRGLEFKQLTLQVSPDADAALSKYCSYHGKSKTLAVSQALIMLGRYRPPR